ncbi:uncharacterized protein [Aegilops tauschii subsp. strangulata]|uniref:uncharacterized protein n=1 Tax=Aegilops tauschii subsp. strangulata TaxID=200361 RepID=UPI001ABC24E2|nr:uncharacterized protein LOC109732087 [Aegilops tauschii subsp. strangulata]
MASSRRSPRAAPLDNDDLLSEILLRLPPQPSFLPRASLVYKRWRSLVSDPGFLSLVSSFLRRFCVHHRRNPPLLGFFNTGFRKTSFAPTLMAPDRVPRGRFSLPWGDVSSFSLLNCRHGLVLIFDETRRQFIVWDPVTGDQHRVDVPAPLEINGAVLRAAGDVRHFQVVFVATRNHGIEDGQEALVCVYSSETGVWGNGISTPIPFGPSRSLFGTHISTKPAVLVGNSLYWTLTGFCSRSILEYDLEKQSLAVIQEPDYVCEYYFMVIRADSGGLGFLNLSEFTAQLWERKTDCDGVASWRLGRTIELDKLLHPNPPPIPGEYDDDEQDDKIRILGFAEENNMVFVGTLMGLFTVQLQPLRFKRLSRTRSETTLHCHPLESVYTAGNSMLSNVGIMKSS